MHPRNPLISVLIAAYNHESYLAYAIKSIWKQSHKNIEIIIVDDCSRDSTYDIAMEMKNRSPYPMKVFRNDENRGISYTFKRTFQLSTGDLISFLASDDFFLPKRFTSQLAAFENNSRLKIIYGNGYAYQDNQNVRPIHSEQVKILFAKTPDEIRDFLYTNVNPVFIQTLLAKRSFMEQFDFLNQNIIADDWYINTKVFENIKDQSEYTYIDEPLVCYRLHEHNVHKDIQRHTKLKLDYITQVTPRKFRRQAKANIYFDIAKKSLAAGYYKRSMKYWASSLKNKFMFSRAKFLIKLITTCCRRLIKQAGLP